MSFSIWEEKPTFAERDLTPGEKFIVVGAYWVVTDDPERATQAEVDALLSAAAQEGVP